MDRNCCRQQLVHRLVHRLVLVQHTKCMLEMELLVSNRSSKIQELLSGKSSTVVVQALRLAPQLLVSERLLRRRFRSCE